MSLAGDVIDRARDVHAAFTRNQTPDAVALRLLTGSRRILFHAATQAHRAAFLTTLTYPLTPTLITDGVELTPSTFIENLRMQVYEDIQPLTLLESKSDEQFSYFPRYAVVEGQNLGLLRLFPADPSLWTDTTAIYVDQLLPLPALTLLTSEVGLLADADEALSMMVAAHMGLRGQTGAGLPAIPVRDIQAYADQAMKSYLKHLAEQRRSASFQITERW